LRRPNNNDDGNEEGVENPKKEHGRDKCPKSRGYSHEAEVRQQRDNPNYEGLKPRSHRVQSKYYSKSGGSRQLSPLKYQTIHFN